MNSKLIIILIILFILWRKKEHFSMLQNNTCSKLCCGTQYPVPFKKKYDEYLCNDDNEYVTSNLTCINSNGGSGCLCITKDQFESLNSRGSNK